MIPFAGATTAIEAGHSTAASAVHDFKEGAGQAFWIWRMHAIPSVWGGFHRALEGNTLNTTQNAIKTTQTHQTGYLFTTTLPSLGGGCLAIRRHRAQLLIRELADRGDQLPHRAELLLREARLGAHLRRRTDRTSREGRLSSAV